MIETIFDKTFRDNWSWNDLKIRGNMIRRRNKFFKTEFELKSVLQYLQYLNL